jgi:hypothetical protein
MLAILQYFVVGACVTTLGRGRMAITLASAIVSVVSEIVTWQVRKQIRAAGSLFDGVPK